MNANKNCQQALMRLAGSDDDFLDVTRVERAIDGAVRAWPGDEVDLWSKWLCEAGASLGLRTRALEGSLREIVDLVVHGSPVALRLESGEWFLVLERRRLKFRVATLDGDDQWISHSQLNARLGSKSDAHKFHCVIASPAQTYEDKLVDTHKGAGHSPSGPSHGAHEGDDHGITPFARLRVLLRPEWSDIWIVLLFAMFVGLLTLATPIAVESLVSTVAFGRLIQPLVVLSVLLFGFLLFAAAMRALQTYVVEIIQRRLFVRVAADIAYRLSRVRQRAWDRAHPPELVNRFFDVISVQKISSSLLLDGVALLLQVLTGMVVVAFYHPLLLAFDLVLLVALVFVVFVLGKGAVKASIKTSKTKYHLAGWLQELARCSMTFKLDGGAEYAAECADRMSVDYLKARRARFKILMRQVFALLFMQALASTGLLALGGWLVIERQLTLGQLVAAELIVTVIVSSLAKLGKHLESFYDLLASVDKLGVLFDLPI